MTLPILICIFNCMSLCICIFICICVCISLANLSEVCYAFLILFGFEFAQRDWFPLILFRPCLLASIKQEAIVAIQIISPHCTLHCVLAFELQCSLLKFTIPLCQCKLYSASHLVLYTALHYRFHYAAYCL